MKTEKICLICGSCGGKNPSCRPEDVMDVPSEEQKMRPIAGVTRDIRRQRAREHYENKERMRIANAMAEGLATMDQIYGGEMLRALDRARKTKVEKKPSLSKRWFG